MTFTFVGIIQLLVGTLLLAAPVRSMYLFVIMSGLFGASAAVTVQALGNSSIPPIQFSLAFMYIRLLMPQGGYSGTLVDSVRENLLIVLFTLYGMAIAGIGPHIFAGQMDVAPLRLLDPRSIYDTVPLQPTAQNITASVNLFGGLLVTLASYVCCRTEGGIETFVRGGVIVGWIHAVTGILSSLTHGTAMDEVFAIFRNGSYAQLDQSYQGFARIDGLFSEASSWASFALTWFFFNCECWYRSILPRRTGPVALALGAVLFASTSSTAYVGLGCYLVFFTVRIALVPAFAEPVRVRQALLAGLAVLVAIALAIALVPHLATQIWDMLLHMTVDKKDSFSGRQRLFWAMQGFDAFAVSGGLGIGPGSFRSSSIVTAILGATGIFGVVTFTAYVFQVMRPLPREVQIPPGDAPAAILGACAIAAFMVLVPASISSPNSHPGANFSMFCGAALAMRKVILLRHRSKQQGQRARETLATA